MSFLSSVSVLLTLSVMVNGANFCGGRVTWKWIEGTTVEFFSSEVWSGNTFGIACPGRNNIWQNRHTWRCTQGCSTQTTIKGGDFNCTRQGYNNLIYVQGEDRWNYTFPDKGPFTISYSGYDLWTAIRNPAGMGTWRLQTTVDLRARNETRTPNSSPIVTNFPQYWIGSACNYSIRIPVADDDGDIVKCRWAAGRECESACGQKYGITLNPDTCTLEIDTSRSVYSHGYYLEDIAIAIVVEDFPRTAITLDGRTISNTNTPLSASPVQFLIQDVFTYRSDCSGQPKFIPDTPDEATTVWARAGQALDIPFVADNTLQNNPNLGIEVNVPQNANVGPLLLDPVNPNIEYRNVTWVPETKDRGTHIVCGRIEDYLSQRASFGSTRCFNILVEVDLCQSQPCQQNGYCINLLNDFVCLCPRGYTGKDCSVDIDECKHMPCENGGKCKDLIGTFECECPPGFSGRICQLEAPDPCKWNMCRNGGRCRNKGLDYICDCVNGWSGDNCGYRYRKEPMTTEMHVKGIPMDVQTIASYTRDATSLLLGEHHGRVKRQLAPAGVNWTVQPHSTFDPLAILNLVAQNTCPTMEYSYCKCVVAREVLEQGEKPPRPLRDVLAALCGIPIGLALAWLTYLLLRRRVVLLPPPAKIAVAPKEYDRPIEHTPTNIYRATFNNEALPTGVKKEPDSYATGITDWAKGKTG